MPAPHRVPGIAPVIYRDYAGSARSREFCAGAENVFRDDSPHFAGSLADKEGRPRGRAARAFVADPETSPQGRGHKTMNGKLFLGLTLSLIGLASAGCTSTPGIVRAQAPPEAGVTYGTPEHPCPVCGCTDGSCSHCDSAHHRFWSHYVQPDAGCGCCCLHSPFPCSTCGDRGPLVYPPNPTPGAIVQYPYYTCKGPDDFFWPPIGQTPAR
jgi:hypothetical protein